MPLFARPASRHTCAHLPPTRTYVRSPARRVAARSRRTRGRGCSRARPRRPASCAVRTVCARTRPHAPFAHDVADAPPGRGDAPPLQRGLDLPGAAALMAVAPDRAHAAGNRVHPLGFGMFDHPVVGGAGNARHPASRRYRITGGVGPYHACFRANAGAARSETSTSISNCLLRLPGPTGSFRPGVRLSVARVEPLSRMPWTQRRGVDRAMSYSALISREGLPFSYNCTICRLNDSS
ncbi:hypothetical protein BBBR_0733 [Bifidobacterium breve DSM 20213 = JCM 1192]|nr:hypothetical protein BBBR_0733 [Bifidobacterium breve DSM 20213 = JCM 1192]